MTMTENDITTDRFSASLAGIVREAAGLMASGSFDVRQKNGYANIVTSSDLAVQEFLKERLQRLLPWSEFLCEEEDRHSLRAEDIWIIDPIDGTQNYSRGITQCGISVGLRRGDEMAAGTVFLPWADEMYMARKGRGATLNGNPIHVSDRPFGDALLCTALPVYYKEHASVCSRIISRTFRECNDIRRFGSAATELCYLARGWVELYFEYRLSPWDFAAASLIVTEAGGCMADLEGNKPDTTKASGIVAANNMESMEHLLGNVRAETRVSGVSH